MGEQAQQSGQGPICAGLVAHVDAGKTTLSEAILYRCGGLKAPGRVDHGNAFLDTDALERQRGITIFAKQAVATLEGRTVTLLDTPGHVDFSGEMERTLSVLDYAILVVSGTDGVQSHTRTVYKLLRRLGVPLFVFVNKMDLPGKPKEVLLQELRSLGANCVDCTAAPAALQEELALCGENAMAAWLETGSVPDAVVADMVRACKLVPCWFGSALKLEGIDALLQGLARWAKTPPRPQAFGARVFKISRDAVGARLTYLKVTGGCLRVKDVLTGKADPGQSAEPWSEKADQLRVYSGEKYRLAETAPAGTVCAVTGLAHTWPGQGLGFEPDAAPPTLAPVLAYQVLPPAGCDAHTLLQHLQTLAQEEPQLHVAWSEAAQEIRVQLMGRVQQEVLQSIVQARFGVEVAFGSGRILYRETIAAPVLGAGHFEPLRHYAEVHLLLEPGAPGSGLVFATACSEDVLDKNWQRLILTHLAEKQHVGVLTGSPLTDVKITLTGGRAHTKHTEGGDFRQATYRAVRQGLRSAQSVLLEPYYAFRLEVPAAQVGRAMADLQRMHATFAPPALDLACAVLTGSGPAATLEGYGAEVLSYTKGQGRMQCTLSGYQPCHNTEEVVAALEYDCDADVENTADSVFCAHGAGYVVPWREVPAHMHTASGVKLPGAQPPQPAQPEPPRALRFAPGKAAAGTLEEDEELEAIFRRTYGPGKAGGVALRPAQKPMQPVLPSQQGPEYLLVDGYNVLFANGPLKELAQTNLDAARRALIDLLCSYQGYRQNRVIVVFDAYKVPQGTGEVTRTGGVYVVYTQEAETADMYIEKATYQLGQLGPHGRVRVATSDRAEQLIILAHDTLRVSADVFWQEIEHTRREISDQIDAGNRANDRAFQRRE